MTDVKKISLKSSDGKFFEIDELVAMESQTLKNMIEDDCANSTIPLPNVNAEILVKVIEYCQKHVEVAAAKPVEGDKEADQALQEWDDKFIDVDQGTLYHLILASNYLNVKGLLDLTCQAVANMIKGKTPEEIRTHFNIENDFTPEQEAEIRKENQWAFE